MAVTESSSPSPLDPTLAKPSTPLVSFLQRVQETAVNTFGKFNVDPKNYIDVSLKFDLSDAGFIPEKELNGFIERYLDGAGDDMEHYEPEDFVDEPEGFSPKVEHPEVRAWALQVHSLWKSLNRRVSSGVKSHPYLHTLLPLLASFIILGSRFRKVYYWDSYWIIKLLLLSLLLLQL